MQTAPTSSPSATSVRRRRGLDARLWPFRRIDKTMATANGTSKPPKKRWRRWLIGILSVALVLATALQLARHFFESPDYTVTVEHDGFEVRNYGSVLVAEVTVSGDDQRVATSAGFRILADYIFGNNTAVPTGLSQSVSMTSPVESRPLLPPANQEVSMTTPVESRPTAADQWVITFVLPSELSFDTAPRPNNAQVILRQRKANQFAVARFSGSMNQAVYDARASKLLADVASAGYQPTGAVSAARYDPPSVLPIFRRNEVMVPVLRAAN